MFLILQHCARSLMTEHCALTLSLLFSSLASLSLPFSCFFYLLRSFPQFFAFHFVLNSTSFFSFFKEAMTVVDRPDIMHHCSIEGKSSVVMIFIQDSAGGKQMWFPTPYAVLAYIRRYPECCTTSRFSVLLYGPDFILMANYIACSTVLRTYTNRYNWREVSGL